MQIQEQDLRTALLNKDVQKVHALLDQGVNLSYTEPGRFGTFLQKAILTNKLEIVEALIKKGANVNLADPTGELPLITAIEQNVPVEIVQSILHAHPNLEAHVRHSNSTILEYVGFHCSSSSIKGFFVQHYPKLLELRDSDNRSILFSLRSAEDVALVQHLHQTVSRQEWESLIAKGNKGQNWLHVYARDPSPSVLKIARILLDSGLDVNAQDDSGQTPLHLAVTSSRGDNIPLISLLLKHGADVNIRDAHGNSSFHLIIKFDRYFRNTSEPAPVLFPDGSKRNYIIQVFELLILHGGQLSLKDEGISFVYHSGQSKTAVDLISSDLFLRLIRNLKKHALYVLIQNSPTTYISDWILAILHKAKKEGIPATSFVGLMQAMGADLSKPNRFKAIPSEHLAKDQVDMVERYTREEEFKLLVHNYVNTKLGLGIRDDVSALTSNQNEGSTTIVSLPLELLFKTIDEMGGSAPPYVKELAQVCVFGISMRPAPNHSEPQKRFPEDQSRYDTLLASVLKIKSPPVIRRLIQSRLVEDCLQYLLANQSPPSLGNLIYHGLNLRALIPTLKEQTTRDLVTKAGVRTYFSQSLEIAEKNLLYSLGKEYLNIRLAFNFKNFQPSGALEASAPHNIYSLPINIFIHIVDVIFEDVPLYLRRVVQALIFPLESLVPLESYFKQTDFPTSGNAVKRYHSHLRRLLAFKESRMIKKLVEVSHDLARDTHSVTLEMGDQSLTRLVKQELSDKYPEDPTFNATASTSPTPTVAAAADPTDFSEFYGLYERT